MFVHNSDRLPTIFDNGGNTENIMFDHEGNPVAIDSMVSCFDPECRMKQFIAVFSKAQELDDMRVRSVPLFCYFF